MNWFVFFLTAIIAAIGFGPYGALLASISTIEKRFGFNSKQSGLIMAAYDIGYLAFAFPSSWLAKKISLGGSLGPAGAAIALGAALNFVPHFGTPNAPILGEEESEPNICSVSRENQFFGEIDQSGWLACFIIAGLLTGMGNSVLWTRGVTAAEDQTNEQKGGVNITICNAGTVAGSLLGLFSSVFFLGIWTDISLHCSVDLDPSDPNWIGAWWLPFSIQFFIACLTFPFLFGYPKVLPGAPERKRSEKTDIGSEFEATKIVLKNACWWFCSIGGICDLFTTAALMGYGMKLLQETYNISASVAGLCGGVCALGGLIGCLIPIPFGTFKLQSHKLLFICFLTSMAASLVYLPSMHKFPCDNQEIFGVFDKKGDPILSNSSNLSSCRSGCSCQNEIFEPVCDQQSAITYFSPCHAGCLDSNLTNCRCDNEDSVAKSLADGFCENAIECDSLWKITICFFFVFAFSYAPLPIVKTAYLRQFNSDEKTTAASLNLILCLLGSITAPIVVGAVIDEACVVWSEMKDGSDGNCLIYDNRGLVHAFLVLPLTMKATAGLCYLAASYFAKNKDLSKIVSEGNEISEDEKDISERNDATADFLQTTSL